jgi:hypothetical protein
LNLYKKISQKTSDFTVQTLFFQVFESVCKVKSGFLLSQRARFQLADTFFFSPNHTFLAPARVRFHRADAKFWVPIFCAKGQKAMRSLPRTEIAFLNFRLKINLGADRCLSKLFVICQIPAPLPQANKMPNSKSFGGK